MRCHIHEDMRVNCLTSRKWITTFLPEPDDKRGTRRSVVSVSRPHMSQSYSFRESIHFTP
jgi:hypothetical protein